LSTISLIPDIIVEIERGNIKLLMWNQEKSWWNIVRNKEEFKTFLYLKVNGIIKDSNFIPFINNLCTSDVNNNQTNEQQQIRKSDTSVVLQSEDNRKRKRLNAF